MSARARELFGLLPVSLLVTGGFTAILITRGEEIETVTITYGAFFLGCCLFAHLFIRARLPEADPYLFPLCALLAAFGLVMIYRIDEELAREQAQWFVFGLLLFCATVVLLRDHRVLERYRYTIAFAGIALLLVWGAAMVMLVFIRDLGSSLMFFGGFLALLYVATARLSLVAGGLAMFVAGAYFFGNSVEHVRQRFDIWQDPFAPGVVEREGYQIAQSLFAQADGGLFGQGFGGALLELPNGSTILPAPHTDLIYAVIADELGLFGAAAVILVYLLLAARGFKTAVLATDGFSKLLATGLTAVLALQVFVIVGGVTKLIPLTGVTLPFVSYGGSSVVANLVLLALLLIVSDRARREGEAGGVV